MVDVRLINLKGPPLHSDDDLVIDIRRASALGESGRQGEVLRWALLFLRHGHFFGESYGEGPGEVTDELRGR